MTVTHLSTGTATFLALHWSGIALWIHILAACVWIGGQITLGALVPIIRNDRAVLTAAARRFQIVAWIAFAMLVVTGIVNVHNAGIGWGDLGSTPTGRTLSIKLGFVILSGAAAALHSLVVGPRASRTPSRSLRIWSGILGALSLLAALAAALYGVIIAES